MPKTSKRRKRKSTIESEKCAEIFHRNGSFNIICVDCDELYSEFQDFVNHFQKIHCRREEETIMEEQPVIVSDASFTDFEAVTMLEPESILDTNDEWTSDNEEDAFELLEEEEDETPNHCQSLNEPQNSEIKLALKFRKNQSCAKCDKKFVSKKNLNKHIRRLHFESKSEDHNCNQCNETFPNRTALCKHDRENHITFSCDMCDKSYKNRRSLKEHLLSHNENLSFVCDYEGCTKAFKNPRLLSSHRSNHNATQKYVCEVCGYQTIRKHTLNHHVRTHTGEKPFPCKICGKHFISSSMVNEHLATHTTERKHVCDVCGASFNRPKSLYHHKHLHLGIKKFVCSICDKAYAQAAGLSAHMRKHKSEGKLKPGLI